MLEFQVKYEGVACGLAECFRSCTKSFGVVLKI